jgi:hypothetical protein
LNEIGERLAARGLAGGQDGPNRIVVSLDAANETQAWVTCLDGAQLMSVQVRSRHRVPRALWADTLLKVNDWNRRGSMTAAWLAVADWDSADDGGIVVEACLATTPDQDVEQVAAFVDQAIAEAVAFWRISGSESAGNPSEGSVD